MGTTEQVPTGEECLYQGVVHINTSPASRLEVLCMRQGPTWGCLCPASSPIPQLCDPSRGELVSGPTAAITPVRGSLMCIDLWLSSCHKTGPCIFPKLGLPHHTWCFNSLNFTPFMGFSLLSVLKDAIVFSFIFHVVPGKPLAQLFVRIFTLWKCWHPALSQLLLFRLP